MVTPMDSTLITLLERELAEHEDAISHIRALLKIKGASVIAPEHTTVREPAPTPRNTFSEDDLRLSTLAPDRTIKGPNKRARRSSRSDDVQFMEFLRVNFSGAFTSAAVMEAYGDNAPTPHTLRGRFDRLRSTKELLAVRYNDSRHYTFIAFPDWIDPDSPEILKAERKPDRADLPSKVQSVKILNTE